MNGAFYIVQTSFSLIFDSRNGRETQEQSDLMITQLLLFRLVL